MYLKVGAASRRIVGDQHPQTCRTFSRLASMYLEQRRYPEAESAALVAYHGYVKGLSAGHERTRRVAEQLADLYTATGQTDKARQWRAKAGQD